jgi:Na+-driven multidrug efflux pump
VLVSSQLNALGETAMAANSITKEFDGFVLEAAHGVGVATIAVVSQNYGAKKPERIKKVIGLSLLMQLVLCSVLGVAMWVFGRTLCSTMTATEEVLELCMVRITTVSILYIALGVLNVLQETTRGIGYSFLATMESIFANIFLRLIYMYFVYPSLCISGNIAHNLRMLFVLYPASWIIASIVSAILLVVLYKKVSKRLIIEREKVELENEKQVEEP